MQSRCLGVSAHRTHGAAAGCRMRQDESGRLPAVWESHQPSAYLYPSCPVLPGPGAAFLHCRGLPGPTQCRGHPAASGRPRVEGKEVLRATGGRLQAVVGWKLSPLSESLPFSVPRIQQQLVATWAAG